MSSTFPYQPAPEGVWRSSPHRMILWAITGALSRIEREIPETKNVTGWQVKLDKTLNDPVRKYAWAKLWTAKHVRKAKNDDGPPVPDEVTTAWQAIVDQIVGELWPDAAETRTTSLDLPFDADVMEQAFQDTAHLVSSIPETMHDRLRGIMRDAYHEQTGPQGFAKQIRAEFGELSKQRADLIAQTEWNRAASSATLEGYKQQGVESKVWYTVGDERVCPTCEANAADGEIPIGQAFYSGDEAPPAHPGCRCDISSA